MSTETAIRFFYDNAGWSEPPGRRACAERLAAAEERYLNAGWGYEIVPDEGADEQPAYGVILRGATGKARDSLWGIDDPYKNDYARVVAAELALEAFAGANDSEPGPAQPTALVAEALGRLRDDDRESVPDAIDLLRRALGLNEEFEPVDNAPAGWDRAEPGPAQDEDDRENLHHPELAAERRLIKRRLRLAGIPIPERVEYDLLELRLMEAGLPR